MYVVVLNLMSRYIFQILKKDKKNFHRRHGNKKILEKIKIMEKYQFLFSIVVLYNQQLIRMIKTELIRNGFLEYQIYDGG